MSTTSSTMIARQTSNKNVVLLIAITLLVFLVFAWNIFQVISDANHDSEYLKTTGDLRVLAQTITANTRETATGKRVAFEDLEKSRRTFNADFEKISKGTGDLPPLQEMLPQELDNLAVVWQRINSEASVIYANRDRVYFLHEVASTLSASIPELQQKYNTVVNILMSSNASTDQVIEAQKQVWRAERIARNVDRMLTGGENASNATEQFNDDASEFGDVLDAMLNGDASLGIRRVSDANARKALDEIAKLFEYITASVDDISQASPDLKNVIDAADKINNDASIILGDLDTLTLQINTLNEQRRFNATTAIALAGALVILGAFIALLIYLNTKTHLAETNATNERNQQAILRLLDELADLADGDLTTTATVTEDFTGAIADSINFTIDQLRILVSQINDTAQGVSNAAEETQSTALHLAEASEHQAQEIAGASAAVNEMAVTIDQVSANAAESSAVAERSVKIANRGAEVVQNTIHGMDTIREQIQDTAKRIKRLGESSQEIGDIVSLINDIADQTNILALNAAIQASMAGDAGRGFAVVADEVQRLAERSSAATKQIEALVKTIQSDTNEAVISMEQTTSEVVRGARLAQDAGQALGEIETVSQELAELIQNISNAARQQAASAGHISNTMNVIQEITQQTSAGTTATARSIGNLADMAIELRNSVAGFTLPEEARDSEFSYSASRNL